MPFAKVIRREINRVGHVFRSSTKNTTTSKKVTKKQNPKPQPHAVRFTKVQKKKQRTPLQMNELIITSKESVNNANQVVKQQIEQHNDVTQKLVRHRGRIRLIKPPRKRRGWFWWLFG